MKIWNELELVNVKYERELADGVHYEERSYVNGEGENVDIYILTVSGSSKAKMAAWNAPWMTTKTVPILAEELEAEGNNVLAAFNAGYFHLAAKTLDPYGMQIIKGKVIQEPSREDMMHSDTWFGCTFDDKPVISDTNGYNEKYKGKIKYAIGGGWIIMRDGKHTKYVDHGVDPYPAAGVAPDGSFAIICSDGRSPKSAGTSCYDLALLLESLDMGIADAMIFDGGGSVTVVVKEDDEMKVRNVPSGPPKDPSRLGELRPVADMMAVVLYD